MKFSTILFPAFIASALASPVQQREESSLSNILSTLQTSVLAHDASLNKTAASLTATSSEDDKAAAVAATNSDIEGLTASIKAASASIQKLSTAEKSGASQQMAVGVYDDIYHTFANMPKDVLASASPDPINELLAGLQILGDLLTGVSNLLTNVLQLVVGVVVATIPGLIHGVN